MEALNFLLKSFFDIVRYPATHIFDAPLANYRGLLMIPFFLCVRRRKQRCHVRVHIKLKKGEGERLSEGVELFFRYSLVVVLAFLAAAVSNMISSLSPLFFLKSSNLKCVFRIS